MNIADMPLSVGSVTPNQVSAGRGASVRIRGSGFQSGAKVMFGNTEGAVTFVDASTLQVATPLLPVGPLRITVLNPGGENYVLDDAFSAN